MQRTFGLQTWFFILAIGLTACRAGEPVFQVVVDFTNYTQGMVVFMQSRNGHFYGTLEEGGIEGLGSILDLRTNGQISQLFEFSITNGRRVNGPLVEAGDGWLYGTTVFSSWSGYGSVFKVSTNGAFVHLHKFSLFDGAYPRAGLTLGSDGNLYGMTSRGGSSTQCNEGCGTVFRITTNGEFKTLAAFDSNKRGALPYTLVTEGEHGWFFGTTEVGGSGDFGTIFKIKPGAALITLHSFGPQDGVFANGLVSSDDGMMVGSAAAGGSEGRGTIFQVSQQGKFTRLYDFQLANIWQSGVSPGGLVKAQDGYFYGSTPYGGTNWQGTIFRITSEGDFRAWSPFNDTIGSLAQTPLFLGIDGCIYGTTSACGKNNYGTLFRLNVSEGRSR